MRLYFHPGTASVSGKLLGVSALYFPTTDNSYAPTWWFSGTCDVKGRVHYSVLDAGWSLTVVMRSICLFAFREEPLLFSYMPYDGLPCGRTCKRARYVVAVATVHVVVHHVLRRYSACSILSVGGRIPCYIRWQSGP